MEVENTLASGITAAGEGAAYDAACKRLLANKSILSRLMKACVDEYKDCDVDEIARKYIEGEPQVSGTPVFPDEDVDGRIRGAATEDSSVREGTVVYDIRFLATLPQGGGTAGLILNVEAQNKFHPGYPIVRRGIYYCGRMLSSQYGVEFTGSHYERLKKVYSIWICTNPPKGQGNTITQYDMCERNRVGEVRRKVSDYDLLSVIMVCLGHEGEKNYGGILKLLDVLLSSERGADEKKRVLREDFGIKMTRTLESEVQNMCNLSEAVVERGIAIGQERGIAIGKEKGIAIGKERGIAIGIEKGIAIGKEKGIAIGEENSTLKSIRTLMETMDFTAEQAMVALRVPENERAKYASKLQK